MKIKRMLTSALAVICMFCMSIPAMAAVPAQDSDFIENQKASTIKAAEAIAYMDVDSASAEMQDRILAAREIIIESKSWIADGFEAVIKNEDGTSTKVPHFSELFPGWDIPTIDSNAPMSASVAPQVANADVPSGWGSTTVYVNRASSTTNAQPFIYLPNWQFPTFNEEMDVKVVHLETSTSCNLGFNNVTLGISAGHFVDLTEGQTVGVLAVPGTNYQMAVRASTYVTPGNVTFAYISW